MKYYIINDTFLPKENFSLRQTFPDGCKDKYYNNSLEEDEAKAIVVKLRSAEIKDMVSEIGGIIVTEEFKEAVGPLLTPDLYTFFNCDISHSIAGKKSKGKYYILQIPKISFFDYDNSVYDGDKEYELIFEVKKMKIRENVLTNIPMARFEELITSIVVNEEIKSRIEAAGLKAIEFTAIEEWTY